MREIIYIVITIFVLSALLFFGVAKSGYAQENPYMLITWMANTYAPRWFNGKIMPTANSLIAASLELIDNKKPVDISKNTIYWYVNNEFIKGGKGIQEIVFKAPDAAGGAVDLRAQIQDYNGSAILKTVEIPIARPEAVIRAPFPNGRFSNKSIHLDALPYFFNIKNLSELVFSWKVNGEEPKNKENPSTLNIDLNPDINPPYRLTIDLSAQNPKNILEECAKSINLTFIK